MNYYFPAHLNINELAHIFGTNVGVVIVCCKEDDPKVTHGKIMLLVGENDALESVYRHRIGKKVTDAYCVEGLVGASVNLYLIADHLTSVQVPIGDLIAYPRTVLAAAVSEFLARNLVLDVEYDQQADEVVFRLSTGVIGSEEMCVRFSLDDLRPYLSEDYLRSLSEVDGGNS